MASVDSSERSGHGRARLCRALIERLEHRQHLDAYWGAPFAIGSNAVTIQAEDFDRGGEGVAYHDTSVTNTGGKYRPDESVDIMSHGSGQYRIGGPYAGEWMEYTISVQQAGQYELEFRVSQTDRGATFHAEVDGVNLTGSLAAPDTGSFNSFASVRKTVSLPAGEHVLRFAQDGKAGNGYAAGLDWIKVSPAAAEPPPPPPSGQSPYHGTPFSIGSSVVTIQAEDFDLGGEGVAYHDTSTSNTGGQYRPKESVDIMSLGSGQYRIGGPYAGEWMEYTISVQQAGQYELEFRVSQTDAGATFHAEVDGVNLTGSLAAPDTGSFNTFASVWRTVSLPAGVHVLRFVQDGKAGNGYAAGLDWLRIAPVSTSDAPDKPDGTKAQVVSQSRINLAWNDRSDDESGFRVERSENGGSWNQVAQVAPNTTSWSDTTVLGGRTYLYRVRAYNAGGASAPSDAAVGVTPIGSGWTPLFNGHNLDGWDTYLPTTGKVASPTVSSSGIFSVHDGMLHLLNIPSTSAEVSFGYLASEQSYDSYHLVLEYKWGTKTFAPRLDAKRDSGLIYHIAGADAVWPRGMEVQIQEGDTGDMWMLAGAAASATVESTSASVKQFQEGGTPYRFGGGGDIYSRLQKSDTVDSLTGWNRVELYVTGDEAAAIVNGKLVNRVYDIRRPSGSDPSGWESILLGRIGLQVEGAEIFYRNVQLRPLDFASAPSGATELFNGGSTSAWRSVEDGGSIDWDVRDGALVVDPGTGDIRTNSTYGDFKLHAEFRLPFVSTTVEQDRANSGIYLQGRYEVQILDSFGRTLSGDNDLGAIYGQRDASVNAALPAELWQSYDITFTAARWNDGVKISDARVTVVLNGITIHDNVAVPASTAFGASEGPGNGPIVLQDHGNLVQFRNIWIESL